MAAGKLIRVIVDRAELQLATWDEGMFRSEVLPDHAADDTADAGVGRGVAVVTAQVGIEGLGQDGDWACSATQILPGPGRAPQLRAVVAEDQAR